uniref:Putative ovule protein n=1 Tax=Solanum chacoense TaxID=4108 RepID=A0A0V0GVD0_SOLCH
MRILGKGPFLGLSSLSHSQSVACTRAAFQSFRANYVLALESLCFFVTLTTFLVKVHDLPLFLFLLFSLV